MPTRLTRREMIRQAALCSAGFAAGSGLLAAGCGLLAGCSRGRAQGPAETYRVSPQPPQSTAQGARVTPVGKLPGKPAMYYEKLDNLKIRCKICPKECVVGDAERGYCGCKENRGGEYLTLVNGRAASVGENDPIEKKPLFHFLPGTAAFSIGAAGCNFNCKNCQNWEISQSRPEQVRGIDLAAERVAAEAAACRCASVAYTYSEPTTFYEYMHDTCVAVHKVGIRNVMISAGFINPEPMEEVCQHLDAVKIDLKSMRDKFYRDNCDGWLQPVLDTIKLVHKLGKWLEIVYLVIPQMNDSREEITDLAKWVLGSLGPDVPLHFSRFFGQYQLKNLPETPMSKLDECYRIARDAGLHYVYVGNVPDQSYATTWCPKCGAAVVERDIYRVTALRLNGNACAKCRTRIPGVWS